MQSTAVALTKLPHARAAARVLGAILLLFVGADHYYEYSVGQYSVLPTIGKLFLLNFVSATVVGLFLLVPLDRISHRYGGATLKVLTVSGFGIAATSLAALLVSEQTPLFGWMEPNYRPAILVAIASEAAAAVSLALLLILTHRAGRSVSKSRSVSRSSRSAMVDDSQDQRWYRTRPEPCRPRVTPCEPREACVPAHEIEPVPRRHSAHRLGRSSARAQLAERARGRDRLAAEVSTDSQGC
jgi:hypothetical protein